MRQRGFTLIEVLFALLILAIVITTSLLIFVDRTRRLQMASETILAYQVLSNEAEVRRRIDFGQLDTAPTTFICDTTLLAPLKPFQTYVTIENTQTNIKNITMVITWRGGQRSARLSMMRADTGGTNLW